MPADTNPHATVQFDDAVFGHQEFNLAHDVGDTIVRRADGLFSYQLVVVVDDLDMGVDDIVRARPAPVERLANRHSPSAYQGGIPQGENAGLCTIAARTTIAIHPI